MYNTDEILLDNILNFCHIFSLFASNLIPVLDPMIIDHVTAISFYFMVLSHLYVSSVMSNNRGRILGRNWAKVFLLAIHSHLY